MISKFMAIVFLFMSNQENMAAIEEFTAQKKIESLSQLVTLLTIALLTILALLTLNLYKVYKLKKEIRRFENL